MAESAIGIRPGYGRSLLLGATFSIAWSPCIGPILAAVLTLAAVAGTAAQGMLLLVAYALGLGVWFLAIGAFFGWLAPALRRIQRYTPALMIASGALFIVVGALMVLGEFSRLNSYFQSFGFLINATSGTEASLADGVTGTTGPAIAFLGGVVSFLSPCVLPLVPVYMANLMGEVVNGRTQERATRRRLLAHSAAFVLGFAAVFAVIGASVGLVGGAVQGYLPLLTRVGGILLIVLGLQLSGVIHLPYLDRTYQLPPV